MSITLNTPDIEKAIKFAKQLQCSFVVTLKYSVLTPNNYAFKNIADANKFIERAKLHNINTTITKV